MASEQIAQPFPACCSALCDDLELFKIQQLDIDQLDLCQRHPWNLLGDTCTKIIFPSSTASQHGTQLSPVMNALQAICKWLVQIYVVAHECKGLNMQQSSACMKVLRLAGHVGIGVEEVWGLLEEPGFPSKLVRSVFKPSRAPTRCCELTCVA